MINKSPENIFGQNKTLTISEEEKEDLLSSCQPCANHSDKNLHYLITPRNSEYFAIVIPILETRKMQ